MTDRQFAKGHRNPAAAIKQLYFDATPESVQRDLATAVELLKAVPAESERERVAVYMDGLSQMRSEWAMGRRGARKK